MKPCLMVCEGNTDTGCDMDADLECRRAVFGDLGTLVDAALWMALYASPSMPSCSASVCKDPDEDCVEPAGILRLFLEDGECKVRLAK